MTEHVNLNRRLALGHGASYICLPLKLSSIFVYCLYLSLLILFVYSLYLSLLTRRKTDAQ